MKYIRVFYLKIFSFCRSKFSIYLNRRVFVMEDTDQPAHSHSLLRVFADRKCLLQSPCNSRKREPLPYWVDVLRRLCFVIVACPVFVCVEVLRPSQPNGVMSSAVSLPNHTFTRQV